MWGAGKGRRQGTGLGDEDNHSQARVKLGGVELIKDVNLAWF